MWNKRGVCSACKNTRFWGSAIHHMQDTSTLTHLWWAIVPRSRRLLLEEQENIFPHVTKVEFGTNSSAHCQKSTWPSWWWQWRALGLFFWGGGGFSLNWAIRKGAMNYEEFQIAAGVSRKTFKLLLESPPKKGKEHQGKPTRTTEMRLRLFRGSWNGGARVPAPISGEIECDWWFLHLCSHIMSLVQFYFPSPKKKKKSFIFNWAMSHSWKKKGLYVFFFLKLTPKPGTWTGVCRLLYLLYPVRVSIFNIDHSVVIFKYLLFFDHLQGRR